MRLTGKRAGPAKFARDANCAQDALRSSGQAGATTERCDGIRQESMFEVRLFGAQPWAAVIEIKKNGKPGGFPFFLFPYADAYVEDIDAGAHRKSGV